MRNALAIDDQDATCATCRTVTLPVCAITRSFLGFTREGESGQVHESLPQVVQGSSGWRVGRTLGLPVSSHRESGDRRVERISARRSPSPRGAGLTVCLGGVVVAFSRFQVGMNARREAL
jgi:hypothetical protein